MQDNAICSFREEYYFLSNFYPVQICFEGITYYSAENAYQSQKCINAEEKKHFSEISADESKRFWEKHTPRSDWEQIKLSVMEAVVREKFVQNPFLAKELVATGSSLLLEGNNWGDFYWGVDARSGAGENHLGSILMTLRQEFQKEGLPQGEDHPVWKKMKSVKGISAVFGSLTQSDCECVVCAASNTRLDKDGLEADLRHAAGKELLAACEALHGCAVGEAKITEGYHLKAKYIIHTVGPCYGVQNDAALLKQCYRNILSLAEEYQIHSIALPVISVGKCSYPKKAASQIAVQTAAEWLREHPAYPLSIAFVCDDLRLYYVFCEYVRMLGYQ